MPSTHLGLEEEEFHSFLTSALDRSEQLTSRPCDFNPPPGKGGWASFGSCFGRSGEQETVLSLKGSELWVVQSVT